VEAANQGGGTHFRVLPYQPLLGRASAGFNHLQQCLHIEEPKIEMLWLQKNPDAEGLDKDNLFP
jgi:hypothetical protein